MKGISYEVWHLIVIIVGFLYSLFFQPILTVLCVKSLNKCFDLDFEQKLLYRLFKRNDQSITISQLKTRVCANPPLIVINRTFSVHRNKSNEYKDRNYVIPYASWKLDYPSGDNTNNYQNQKPYIVTIKTDFNIIPNLLVTTNEKLQELERELDQKGTRRQKIVNKIYHIDDIMIFPGDSCFVNMCNSKRCNILYLIFNSFGFGPIYVNIYGLFLNRATMYTKRSLSDTDEYPNRAFEPDPSFGEIGESVPASRRLYL